jgi:phage terminase large subunit-like protein
MANQNLAIKSTLNDPSYTQLSGMTKWEAKRETGETVKRTLVAAIHEQGRAHLTNMALENVGALSALENHLTQIAPQGAERYRHIVDAYALGAAQKIAGW